ncbi:hypothetical protein LDENG_00102490 [Lucifuga dentata]|nr:hypothetical protein LDENG_00102490 [Lucifuga dentata]
MDLTAAACGIVVFLLSVSVVHGENRWGVRCTRTPICSLKGSTVEISCSYDYPQRENNNIIKVEKRFWFKTEYVDLRVDSEYAGRVQYICHEKSCTLRLIDVRESDSAEYKFRFTTSRQSGKYSGVPGVTLTVTALQVQPSVLRLECHSHCSLLGHPSYIWYKNGQKMTAESYSFYYLESHNNADSYACAVKGQENISSPSVCVSGESCNKVTYTNRTICAHIGSTVDISCTYNSNEARVESKLWFRDIVQGHYHALPKGILEDSRYADRLQLLETEEGRSTLRIRNLRESDSAVYRFKFRTKHFEWKNDLPGTTLTVTGVQVMRSGRELSCHTTCSLPGHVSWYKNGGKMMEETFNVHLDTLDPRDSYSCVIKGHEDFSSPSVCVSGENCNKVTYTNRNTQSEDVRIVQVLNASQFAGRIDMSEISWRHSTLTIRNLRESDSAEYRFKFSTQHFEWKNDLPGTTLTVTALHVQVSRLSVNESSIRAELKCLSSCHPAGRLSYIWFKNGQKMKENSSSYTYHFSPADSISCALEGYEDFHSALVYAPKVPSVSLNPSGEIMEGSLVTLNCSSDANPAANYTWYRKNGNPDLPLSKDPHLVFSSIKASDSGEFYCKAENELGMASSISVSVDVEYAPKNSSLSVSFSAEAVEGSSMTLTCSSDANPAATYTWYKKNQTLLHGLQRIYYIASISSEDGGTYHCESENQHGRINSTSLFIDVQYAPKLPSVSTSHSAEIVVGSSVTLTCSSDANPEASYTWYKEDEDSPKASGQIYNITDIRPEHAGTYYCEAHNSRGRHISTLHLTVPAVFTEAWKSAAAGTVSAFLLAATFLFVFLWIRRRKTSKESSEADARTQVNMAASYSNASAAAQKGAAEPQEKEEGVEYTAINFNSARSVPW